MNSRHSTTHENWSREEGVKASSDRFFGLVLTIFFAILAFLPMRHHHPARVWALVLSGLLCCAALLAPKTLAPLNRVWTALGALLHTITNPIILGILFYLVFTPIGWVRRRMGKSLHLTRVSDVASYWIPRQPPGPEPRSMANQF